MLRRVPFSWIALAAVLIPSAPLAADSYARAGYRAVFTQPGQHDAVGSATIVDERTIQIDHFTYDGTAPAVYLYLGEHDTQADFENGFPIGPMLDRAYADESVTVQLPAGQSLDGYGALSVWCVTFTANFGSGEFPWARADFDIDGDVDRDDYDHFRNCVTGAAVPQLDPDCADTDLDLDGDTDHWDFAAYQRCISGQKTPAVPGCAG
jgi:hypothetical protein